VLRNRTSVNHRFFGAAGTGDRVLQVCATRAPWDGWRVIFSSRETLRRTRRDPHAKQRAVFVAPLQTLLESIFGVLFPSECRLCHTPLDNVSRIPVCRECLDAIEPVRSPQCVICGDRLVSAQLLMGDGRCTSCRDFEPEFERAVSFGEYEGGLRGLIHLLKYESVIPVASPLGHMMAKAMQELLAGRDSLRPLLVPVPLHKNRRRARGFNQSELIARSAAKDLSPRLELDSRILVRQRDTISQVGLSREERMENVRGAFQVNAPERVRGRILIVVDDVMTTGTTLSECARVLKQAGAERVWAATVARAFQGAASSKAADPGEEEAIEAEAVTLAASV
jgi:ComF family protein